MPFLQESDLTTPPPDSENYNWPLPDWPLIERPGFLIRRMYQIHVALFAQYCQNFDITPVQCSLLWVLAGRGTADQTTLAAEVFLDRTTAVGALKRLESRGLVARTQSLTDRRAQLCKITSKGIGLLKKIESLARAAHHDTLAILNERERETFISLMKRVVAAAGSPGRRELDQSDLKLTKAD